MKLLASTPARVIAFIAGVGCCLQRRCAQTMLVPAFGKVDFDGGARQGCVTCHGQSGQGHNSGYFPRIAGKAAAYLYNQLVAFRDARAAMRR
jgi:cytochrome c553